MTHHQVAASDYTHTGYGLGGGFNFNAGLMQAAKIYQQQGPTYKLGGPATFTSIRKTTIKKNKVNNRAATSTAREN